ncbi:MAG: Ig-like domain-containing protein [Flavobacteriaceae bacterium]
MKQFLQPRSIFNKKVIGFLLFSFFVLFASKTFAQNDITYTKSVVQNDTNCNQFDITLELIGNPPPQPVEVVLIIDRSGSMDDGPSPDPIDYAKDAAIEFVQNLFSPANNPTGLNRVSVVSYADSASTNIGLTNSSGQQAVINAINAITVGGNTNIQSGLILADNQLTNNGTFDCKTSRNIILLTDGVANRDNNGNVCSNNPSGGTSACIQNAITAGVNAQTTTVAGQVYNQNIFSIGLFGAISGSQQTTATNTINAIQNSGLYTTETGADLSGIYNDILGQLGFAGIQIPGVPFVEDTITTGFSIVSGSISVTKGTFQVSGQNIDWFISVIEDETVIMNYSIEASAGVCGPNESGKTFLNYQNGDCAIVNEQFTNPGLCVPCPSVTAQIARQGCSNFIDYTGNLNQGGCTSASDEFSWEFFLNGILVGTSNQLTGTFQYTGGTAEGNFTAILSYDGTYGSGCTLPSVTDDATIIIPPAINATAVVDNVECNGDSSGNIDLTVTGGTPPYTFVWSNGATTEDLTNIPAGSYNVSITDVNGCSFTFVNGLNVTQPEPISIQITKVNATLSGLCLNGQATATASGGTPPFTYQWGASTGNQTGQTATNLPVGTHTVTVTDANNCTLQQSVAIDCFNDCDTVIAVNNVTNVLCKGDATGSATVSASSNVTPGAVFTFTWSTTPPQVTVGVTSTINNLTAGVYTVSVTKNGTLCLPVEQSITITEPSTALNVTATATDESGPTTGDGTATANASGGTPPYTYLWNPGGQTTQTITGLSAGVYTVTVTDAHGCTDTATVTVNPGTCQNLAVQASSTPATCNGDSDGTATANVTGGSGNFSYAWSNGGTTQIITGLSAGTYSVTVTDNVTLCSAQSTTTVNQPVALSSGIAVNNVPCHGDSTGSLDLTVTGGTSPYTFLWSNGATTEDITGLTAGNYSVTITDANGCTATNSATVQQPTAALSLQVLSQTDILCGSQSSVTVEATGGTAPYLYSLDGGTPQASGTFSNVAEGLHSVSVVDGNACTTAINITILSNCTDAIDDINDTLVNVPVSGNVLTNDEDAEGDTQTVTTVGTFPTAQGGSVTLNADGSYTYTPPAGFVGTDSFDYSIIDNGNPQATDTATVTIEVRNGVGNSTIANNDIAGTEVDTPVSGNVLVNDIDLEGDNQVVTTVGTFPTTQGGSITINADGSFTYTPPSGFTGEDTFTYSIVDDNVNPATDSATLTITVNGNPGNNQTYANDDAYSGNAGATITGNVLDNDSDPEGDLQTVNTTPVSGPNNGTVTINPDGSFSYVPNDPNYQGPDQFVYEVCDNGTPQACDQATVYITIFGVNTTDAINDINNTYVNIPVSGNVLTNDEDEQGDTQVVTTVGTFPTTAGGSVTINADGSYIYTPPAGYVGPDTFQYSIADDGNPVATDTATVFIEVLPINQNTTIANADTAGTEVNTPVSGNVLVNDYDPQGDTQVVTNVGTFPTAQGGSITINADGSFTYIPPAGFTGEDTFEYFIIDDNTVPATDSAILTITVNGDPGKNRTYANDDAYNGNQGATITGNVLDNDTDPEGHNQFVDTSVTPVSGPSNGTLVINADGTFTYTPNDPSFFGTDQFVYEIFDNGSPVARDRATVIITLFGNNTTDAVNDINDTLVNVPVSGNVLTNDEDAEGDTQTVTTTGTFATAQGGSVTLNADGSYTYTPPAGFVGTDSFDYSIVDNGNPQAVDTATVTIEVRNGVGNSTIANNDIAGTEVNTPVNGNVLVNDIDLEGDNQVVTTVGTFPTTQGGSITINADGSFIYNPPAGFTGEDTFTYSIIDDNAVPATDSATLTITVNGNPGNNQTYANDDAYSGNAGATITGNVLDNDSDPEGDIQTVNTIPVSGPSNGTVTLNPDGTFSYVPNNPSYQGTDQFVYEVCDNGTPQACDQATVYITIFGVNTTYAINDINDTLLNTPVSGNVLTNDRDDQGDAQIVTTTGTFATTQGGSVTINADGSYIYTPPVDFVGFDSFPYSIADDGNPVATDDAIVTIEVIRNISNPNTTIANDDTAQTLVDLPVPGNVLVNDFDPQNDNQVVTNVGTFPTTQGGSISINADGSFIYTPPAGFVGDDTFEYFIADDGSPVATDSATLTITVYPIVRPNYTFANDDAYFGYVNMPINGNVLLNDTDPEGDNQSVAANSPLSGPSNGTLVLNANGTFVYTPNPGFFGTDQFVYQVIDDGSPVASDFATVFITIPPQNTTYAINDVNATLLNTPVSGNVLTNDRDDQGDNQFVTSAGTFATAQGGSVTINADGSYIYTPPTGYIGFDSFPYSIQDDGVLVANDNAVVTIEVVPTTTNNSTIANDDTAQTLVDLPVPGNVLVNDFDPQGDSQVVTNVGTFPTTQGGSITINADGSFIYTPPAGFVGDDTFEYFIADNGSPVATDSATLTITVYPIVRPNYTFANDDLYYTEPETAVNDNVSLNDSDPEGNNQTFVLISGPSNGTLTFNADGTFTYTPNPGFQGTDSFIYQAVDNGTPVATDLATVTIVVQQTANPAIAIVKAGVFVDGDGDQCADAGEAIDYTFTVTNQGNVPLSAVSVTDPLLQTPNPVVSIVLVSGDDNNDGILDLTETWIYTASYAITQADIDAAMVTNQATAEGTDPDGTVVSDLSDDTSVLENDPTVVDLCRNSSMSIIKNQTNQVSAVGDVLTYDIIVTNTGNTTLSNIVVTDANATITGGNPIATLAPGASATVTAEHIVTQADIDLGYIENIAVGTGDSPTGPVNDDSDTGTDVNGNPIPDPETVETPNGDGTTDGDPTNDPTVTVITQTSSMSIIKNQTNQVSAVGDVLTYDIIVTNTGNTTLSNIVVTDANATITGAGNLIVTFSTGASATVTVNTYLHKPGY